MKRFLEGDQVETDVVELACWAMVNGDVFELKDHIQLAARRIGVQPRLFGAYARHLAHGDVFTVAAPEDLAGHLGEVLVYARSIDETLEGDDEALPSGGNCVRQPVGLGNEIDDIQSEAVDTAVEPPNHGVLHSLSNLGVIPVQIRLLAIEQVEVVLISGRFPRPRRAGEE